MVDLSVDLRAIERLERKAAKIGKTLMPAVTSAAQIVRKETRRLIRQTPIKTPGRTNKRLLQQVRYKGYAKDARVIVFVIQAARLLTTGTEPRYTKSMAYRGSISARYWLYNAAAAKLPEVVERIAKDSRTILL